tara:strand:- start:1534 stop:1755 length:222 start_codon:yes stop_codon:yes gene_type:complete
VILVITKIVMARKVTLLLRQHRPHHHFFLAPGKIGMPIEEAHREEVQGMEKIGEQEAEERQLDVPWVLAREKS